MDRNIIPFIVRIKAFDYDCIVFIYFNITYSFLCFIRKVRYSGADPQILKRGDTMCQSLWLVGEENFWFQMFWKGQNNVRKYKFLVNYFYQHFEIFSIFIYNESLAMNSYQSFKICKRFDKEREKTLMQPLMRKEKVRKVGFCFIKGCLIKSFNKIINHSFVLQAHSQPNLCLLILGWRKKYQKQK